MSQVLLNPISVNLIMWETNSSKKNQNNIIKLCLDEKKTLEEKDLIIGDYSENGASVYEVVEIIEIRKASLSGKNYITLKTSWKKQPMSFFKTKDLSNTSKGFQNLVGN